MSPLVPLPLYLAGAILLAVALVKSQAIPTWSAWAIGIGGMFPIAALTGIGVLALPSLGEDIARPDAADHMAACAQCRQELERGCPGPRGT